VRAPLGPFLTGGASAQPEDENEDEEASSSESL
jgi:hypothetical protein